MDRATHEDYILVLQGGGALGAYQAGVFEALSTEGMAPNWVTGISIGAINCAIIAGNAPERRVERLRQFWNTVSAAVPKSSFEAVGDYRALLSSAAATGGSAAYSCATARARSSACPGSATSLAKPMRPASAPSKERANPSSSRALARPTRCCRCWCAGHRCRRR